MKSHKKSASSACYGTSEIRNSRHTKLCGFRGKLLDHLPFNHHQNAVTAYADDSMIDTVVRNLTANALKFTSAGGRIELSAAPREHDVVVSVSDSGSGIAEKHAGFHIRKGFLEGDDSPKILFC